MSEKQHLFRDEQGLFTISLTHRLSHSLIFIFHYLISQFLSDKVLNISTPLQRLRYIILSQVNVRRIANLNAVRCQP